MTKKPDEKKPDEKKPDEKKLPDGHVHRWGYDSMLGFYTCVECGEPHETAPKYAPAPAPAELEGCAGGKHVVVPRTGQCSRCGVQV